MQLTRAGDYGYLGLLYLARQPKGKIVRLSEICESEGIPEKFLAKIFQNLTKTGLVKSYRGAKGGFTLGKPKERITVKEMLETLQGPMLLTQCLVDPEYCDKKKTCPLRKLWVKGQDYIIKMLKGKTLADLAAQ